MCTVELPCVKSKSILELHLEVELDKVLNLKNLLQLLHPLAFLVVLDPSGDDSGEERPRSDTTC